jgi:hypothetical protein
MIEYYRGRNIILLIPELTTYSEWFIENVDPITRTEKLGSIEFLPFEYRLMTPVSLVLFHQESYYEKKHNYRSFKSYNNEYVNMVNSEKMPV